MIASSPGSSKHRQGQEVGELGAERHQHVVARDVVLLRSDDQVAQRRVAEAIARFHQRQIERQAVLHDFAQAVGPSFRVDEGVDGPLLALDVPAEIAADVEELAQFLRFDVHPCLLRLYSPSAFRLPSPVFPPLRLRDDPALHDRITRVDRFMGPDEPCDPFPR